MLLENKALEVKYHYSNMNFSCKTIVYTLVFRPGHYENSFHK